MGDWRRSSHTSPKLTQAFLTYEEEKRDELLLQTLEFNGWHVYIMVPYNSIPTCREVFDSKQSLVSTFGFVPTLDDFVSMTRHKIELSNSLHRYRFPDQSYYFGIKNSDGEIIDMTWDNFLIGIKLADYWDDPEVKPWIDFGRAHGQNFSIGHNEVFG